eukprot:403366450
MCQDEGKIPVVYSNKNIKLAVCMAIFDSESKLLMTRRNIGLRVFPHAWVMPGGHIDMGESLEEGVVREILEETGIKIDLMKSKTGENIYFHNKVELQMEPFYAFESVSSFAVDHLTPPSGGHLIVFFRVQLNQKGEDINLKLQVDEVDAAVWLSKNQIENLLKSREPQTVIYGVEPIDSFGNNKQIELRLSQFFPNYPNKEREGVSKAHNKCMKYMLQQYFQVQGKL